MDRFWPIDKKNFFFFKKRLSKFEIMRRKKPSYCFIKEHHFVHPKKN